MRGLGWSAVLLTAAVAALWPSGCAKKLAREPVYGAFTDGRDGKTYKSVKMPDGKTWMAENLNYRADSSWCYNDDASYCDKYGRLYDWEAAMTACPDGWHLPSREDWDSLARSAGGEREREGNLYLEANGYVEWRGAGKKLKAANGWADGGAGGRDGTDDYGFSAAPGGSRFFYDIDDGNFKSAAGTGYWWTSTEKNDAAYNRIMNSDDDEAYCRVMSRYDDDVSEFLSDKEDLGYSVRCVRHADKKTGRRIKEEAKRKIEGTRGRKEEKRKSVEKITSYFTDSRDGRKYRAITLGGKTWMAENLNYTPESGASWCYNDSGSYCARYGRLYEWETAKKACPAGWHLPSLQEWEDLGAATADDYSSFSKSLRAKSGWSVNYDGADDYGFAALAGGCRGYYGSNFGGIGNFGYWWSSTADGGKVYYMSMNCCLDNGIGPGAIDEDFGVSVRCVKD